MTDQIENAVRDLEATADNSCPLNGRSSASDGAQSVQAMFRLLAAERDAAVSQTFDLARLWLELCRGTWRFRDTFPTENRYIALIEEPSARFPQPLKACKLGVLKRVLLGEAPKAVAIE